MKRKVVQQGPSTLMVSLPAKWVKRLNIKKGDELEVEEKANGLNIEIDKELKPNEINIDLSNFNRASIILTLRSAYRMGYDIINFKFKNEITEHIRSGKKMNVSAVIHEEVDRLIGLQVINQTENFMVMKDFSTSSIVGFDSSLRRLFLLLNSLAEDFSRALKTSNQALIMSIEEKHDNITKFVSYNLRLLNKKGYPQVKKTSTLYHIIAAMDMIVDRYKYASREFIGLENFKLNDDILEIIDDIKNSVNWFYEFFYDCSREKELKVLKNRYDVKEKIKKIKDVPEKEIKLVANLEHVLDIISDKVLARMCLNTP